MNTSYCTISNDTYRLNIVKSLRRSLSIELVSKYTLLVKSPIFVDTPTIMKFIRKKERWISKQNRYLLNFSELIPTDLNVPINILESPHYLAREIPITSLTDYKEEAEKWLKKYSRGIILPEVRTVASEIGVEYNRISIRSQKTRWGSCSSRGNLNFNWKIILTKKELLRYLIIHELAHLLEMNHSANFWNIVKKYDPDYIKHRRELRSYGPLLKL